mgnify:CR=1 FL=1
MGRKHVPQRTCIACRQVRGKRELVRVVRTPDGEIDIDETGKKAGRGAYLCRSNLCWEQALKKGTLDRALKTTVTVEDRERLREYAQRFPEKPVAEEPAPVSADQR